MKLDITDEQTKSASTIVKKKENNVLSYGHSKSIIDMLNPLKSININSDLHSFYNFRESKENIEALIKAQENLIFYVLHQNFMCDEDHKEFFKNMVGRFYEMPEWSWKYYQGEREIIRYAIIGLVLTENYQLSEKYIKVPNPLNNFEFYILNGKKGKMVKYNKCAIEEYFGVKTKGESTYFSPFNRVNPTNTSSTWSYRFEPNTFENDYEFGRFQTNKLEVKRKSETLEKNYWFIASYDWIEKSKDVEENFEAAILNYGVYASLGLDNFDQIITAFKARAKVLDVEWEENWEEPWDEDACRIIRSLSQTFPWSKEYIMENEELLDLDVLGLNMTVPWDMELVKFFIDRGYGGRMSENKAVYDKVFEQLLTDDILKKLFSCEYTPYE